MKGVRCGCLGVLGVLLLAVAPASVRADGADPGGDRSFFHLDLNASGFYSAHGADLSGTTDAHWQPTDRLPRNYVGCEYIHTFGERSAWRSLLGPLQLTTVDLNPHIEVDFNPPVGMNPGGGLPTVDGHATSVDINSDHDRRKVSFKLVLHDFWVRFEPAGWDRTSLRVGHFDIPYGVNPIMAPRGGMFVMPPEVDDLGFKKDWGAVWKGPLGAYDYELAATTGTGLGLHAPYWFDGASRTAYAFSGRAGAPTYWRFQYGLSALYGKIPTVMADERLDDRAPGRWRVSADTFYKLQEHTMFMAQFGFGQNGDNPSSLEAGSTKVLAAHVLVDHVPRWWQEINVKAQFKTVYTDLDASHSDQTLALFEVAYSITTPLTVRLDYMHDFTVPRAMEMMGREADDRFYLTINYYN